MQNADDFNWARIAVRRLLVKLLRACAEPFELAAQQMAERDVR